MLLAVVSPGVDGEITTRRFNEILKHMEQKGSFLQSFSFRDSQGYEKFLEVNRQINLRTNSYSHTFEMIRKIIGHNRASSVVTNYRKKFILDQVKWSISFPVELEPSLMDKIFLFDLRLMDYTGCINGAKYESVLDAFLNLKQRGAGGTEVDFSFVPLQFRNGTYDEPIFIFIPCNLAQGELREEILSVGLRYVQEQRIRKALIMRRDFPYIPDELVHADDGDFLVIGK
jgi:hypothetical protein